MRLASVDRTLIIFSLSSGIEGGKTVLITLKSPQELQKSLARGVGVRWNRILTSVHRISPEPPEASGTAFNRHYLCRAIRLS